MSTTEGSLDCVVAFSPQAVARVTEALNRAHELRSHYGDAEADRYLASFGLSFARLVSMGGNVRDAFDYDGLIASTSRGLVVGLVFHSEKPTVTLERTQPDQRLGFVDTSEWPRSGTWSLNS